MKYTFPYDGDILGASIFSIYIFFEVFFAYLNIRFYTCNSLKGSPHGAQEEVLQIASKLGIGITVGLAHQSSISGKGVFLTFKIINNPNLMKIDV